MVIQDRYHILNKVGEGSFSSVYFAMDRKNNRAVAVKMETNKQINKLIKFEGFVLRNLKDCHFVPKYIGLGHIRSLGVTFLITEFLGPTL